jgi:hypothetical protein
VRFCVEDADQQLSPCDLVLILDAFHHFPRPDVLLANIHAALRPLGKLILAETSVTGDLDADLVLPWARIVFSSNLLLCLQEGLYDNGAGIGSTAGKEVIEKLLANNGFGTIEAYEAPVGYTIFVAAS